MTANDPEQSFKKTLDFQITYVLQTDFHTIKCSFIL